MATVITLRRGKCYSGWTISGTNIAGKLHQQISHRSIQAGIEGQDVDRGIGDALVLVGMAVAEIEDDGFGADDDLVVAARPAGNQIAGAGAFDGIVAAAAAAEEHAGGRTVDRV